MHAQGGVRTSDPTNHTDCDLFPRPSLTGEFYPVPNIFSMCVSHDAIVAASSVLEVNGYLSRVSRQSHVKVMVALVIRNKTVECLEHTFIVQQDPEANIWTQEG